MKRRNFIKALGFAMVVPSSSFATLPEGKLIEYNFNDMNVLKGIRDELENKFGNVMFELTSDITKSTQTYKLAYQEVDNVKSSVIVMDENFNESTRIGFKARKFLVRLDKVGPNVIVRRIISRSFTMI